MRTIFAIAIIGLGVSVGPAATLTADTPETKLRDLDLDAQLYWDSVGVDRLNLHINTSDAGVFWYDLDPDAVRAYVDHWIALDPLNHVGVCVWEQETANDNDHTDLVLWATDVFGGYPRTRYYVEELPRRNLGDNYAGGDEEQATRWAAFWFGVIVELDPDAVIEIHNERDWRPWRYMRAPWLYHWALQAGTAEEMAELAEEVRGLGLSVSAAELTDPRQQGDSDGIPPDGQGGLDYVRDWFDAMCQHTGNFWIYSGYRQDGCTDLGCPSPQVHDDQWRFLASVTGKTNDSENVDGLLGRGRSVDYNGDGVADVSDISFFCHY